ncbi:hypothetical protein HPB50_021042 [Hyalomma asiaticum]|uniref:Uncharacterized protein n=1 Tax=Hyalomma asiaticum TaxID=266040 RepID=A0ACB7S891_HYAAI|nr:hypothetical protein HPB50_021042 [Hyalomma asiaticum]
MGLHAQMKLGIGVRPLHDNAAAHSALETVTHAGTKFCLTHRAHVTLHQSTLHGKHFQDDEVVVPQVELFLNSQNEESYCNGLQNCRRRLLVHGRRTDPFLLTMDKENKLELHRNVKMSQAIERVARYMFPICFGFFNVVYWSFYVERSYYYP